MLDPSQLGPGGPAPAIPLPGGAGPGQPPQSIPIPGQPDSPDSEQALQDAIDAVGRYLQAEKDPVDLHQASKVLATLHGLMGGRQKELDAATGVTPAIKAMRRSLR